MFLAPCNEWHFAEFDNLAKTGPIDWGRATQILTDPDDQVGIGPECFLTRPMAESLKLTRETPGC